MSNNAEQLLSEDAGLPKLPLMNERLVQDLVGRDLHFNNNIIGFCGNAQMSGWYECDMAAITRSMFFHEYEIKCSRSDFKADFRNKVSKHDCLKNKKKIETLRYGTHESIINRRGFCWIGFREVLLPNYFWFITTFELKPGDIPDYAGHMLVKYRKPNYDWEDPAGRHYLKTIKKAPLLHRRKVKDFNLINLYEKIHFKYWHDRLIENE